MKSVAIITGMLLLAGCVVAPVPVRVAPPIAVVAPPGVVYARPAYPLPGPGYVWAYHPHGKFVLQASYNFAITLH